MKKIWLEPPHIIPPADLVETVGGHPLIAQTLASHGVTDPRAARGFLDPAFYTPSPPSDLPNLARAASRIETAIQNRETILVWGDFDVDGQTATTLLAEALHQLGATVVYHIPVRASEGHGINPRILDTLLSPTTPHPHTIYPFPINQNVCAPLPPNPKVLLTCDTGITEHQACEIANSHGVDVIITDHHELPETLPQAYAVINPHLLYEDHPLSTLPGVGVAYKLVEELYNRWNQTEIADRYLDLVALGIVADVAMLVGDTRYLLQRGLTILRKSQRLGLLTLFKTAGINPDQLDESHISFGIGPRLNAVGRLSDASIIVEFLTTTNPNRAKILAHELESLNQRRKLLTELVYEGALALIERDRTHLDYSVLVLSHLNWPNGVLGIVASRLVERFNKPTILISEDKDGWSRGSARSIPGIHITQAIANHANLLGGYGGHAGAAGLSLNSTKISEFRAKLSRTIRSMATEVDLTPTLQIDAFLSFEEVTQNLVDDIQRLAPFGMGNHPLTLASRKLKLVSTTHIGRSKEHLRLVIENDKGFAQEVIWWRGANESRPENSLFFDLAYRVNSHTFRGEPQTQLEWIDYALTGEQVYELAPEIPPIKVIDFRNEIHPLGLLNEIRNREDIQVWAEGDHKTRLGGIGRFQLKRGNNLVVWTAPPSHLEFKNTLKQVKPELMYLFIIPPDLDSASTFLPRLSGLVKYVLNKRDGHIYLDELATAMAHTSGTVHMGLLWLQAKGHIQVTSGEQTDVQLYAGTGKSSPELMGLSTELNAILEETAAYRKYLQHAKIESLDLNP